jgi:hypothetical protein
MFGAACSSSKESSGKNGDDESEVYVFDEVPVDNSHIEDGKDSNVEYNYFVQIGAFATKSNAEKFSDESAKLLNEELEIQYDNQTYLFQVKLKKVFFSRIEAAIVRDKIRLNEKYLDAWIQKEVK